MANGETVRKDIMAVVKRGNGRDEKSFWTRIGSAFLMRDGKSWDCKFDFFPANLNVTGIQLRDPRPKQDADDAEEPAPNE